MHGRNSIFLARVAVLLAIFITAAPGMSAGASPQLGDSDVPAPPYATSGIPVSEQSNDTEPSPSVEKTARAEEQEELLELLAVLEQETEIATKTRMNSDYVPGMVTVLHGEQLEALGVHTVAEALTMVPGIQLSRVFSGEPSVKIRGIAFPFNSGNIKVMLNSIALSRESSGINSSVLLTPVAQVDRIEIVRGPGSSLYGDFALSGVVNIITKNAGGRVFARAGSDHSKGGGGHYAYHDDEIPFGVGLNVSLVDDGENAVSLERDPDEQRFTGVFKLDYRDFAFTAEGVRRSVDLRNRDSSDDDRPGAPRTTTSQREESWAIEGRQTIELGRFADIEPYITYLRNDRNAEVPLSEFRGDRVEAGFDANWSPWTSHQLHFGFSYTYSDIDDAANRVPGDAPLEVSGVNRRNFSLSVQDQAALTDRFSLTLGLRFDDYDDVGNLLTPRIAGVYRLGEHHVIKAQYSESFRAPTFWELYATGRANENLDFEVIKTTELAYVYRRPNAVGRLTLYYSRIDDGIYRDAGGGYTNSVGIESKGIEVEWEQRLGDGFRWLANISYVDARDGRSGPSADDQSLGVADWLGNLVFFLQPLPEYMVTGRFLYVGDRHTLDGWIEGYESLDLTVSRMDLWVKGLTARIGVKDLFDHTIKYVTSRPNGLTEDEFPGRTFWLQVSYDL